MGAVKEYMEDKINWAAQQSGQNETEVMDRWNENLRHRPEQMISIEEFVNRQKYKQKK